MNFQDPVSSAMLPKVRREYLLKIEINGRLLKRVLIDSHYEKKHAESVTDSIILELVKTLIGQEFFPEQVTPTGFEIFKTEKILLGDRLYRLIWTLPPGEKYLCVINAFRRR